MSSENVETFPPGLPGFSNNLSGEPQLQLLSLLEEIGYVERLDLFLYTRGGTTEAVWPIITALREHCDTLGVLVPFRAHSAGTLLCLGADEVVMMPGAELSPIDPTTGNQFNPVDPANPQGRFGISVEDVVAYFKLAEDRAEIHDEAHRAQVFRELTSQVHPLALGNVQRVYIWRPRSSPGGASPTRRTSRRSSTSGSTRPPTSGSTARSGAAPSTAWPRTARRCSPFRSVRPI
jgi:hypothetical protein